VALGSIGLAGLRRQIPPVRAVLLLSLVMIVATVLTATALLLDLRHKELARAKREIVSLTRILAEQTTRTFEGVALMMRGVRERLADERGQSLELDSQLVKLLLQARSAGLPQVKSIFVADRQGFGVNSSRADFIERLSMSDREFFRYFSAGGGDEILISRPERARVDGRWTYYVSMRLLDSAGKFRGVLAAAISIEHFESLYDSIGLDFVRRIQLLNGQGVLLAGQPHDEQTIGAAIADAPTLAQLQDLPAGDALEISEQLANGRRFVAYRRIANYPLMVSAAIDEEDALTPWRNVMRPLVASLGLVLLFVLATTWLVVKNLLRRSALESALKESDEQLRTMVHSVQDAIVTIDAARRVRLFNGAAERMFALPAGQALGRDIEQLLAQRLAPAQARFFKRYLEGGGDPSLGAAPRALIDLIGASGEFPVELTRSASTFHGEALLTLVFRDLSESRRIELDLLETNRQLKELSASLQRVREEARARIARELHDELGQLLTGIRMEVSWLGGRLLPEQQLLHDKVVSIKSQIDQTIASVRRISSELRPLVLDDLGFAAAANWYVDQFSARTGLPVELILPDRDPERGDAIATALFRVLQESLTNVARHARATKVYVRLDFLDGSWVLSVRDDGIGFMHDRGKLGDMGLVGMRERAQILGGKFSITTAPGAGTLIEVFIPAELVQ
jgi:PAS domain S-box-containing protein